MSMSGIKATFDDLEELSPEEALEKSYREYKEIEAFMKVAAKRRAYAREKMITYLIDNNRTDLGNEGIKVHFSRKLGPKIEDMEALKEYVMELDEPDSTYLELTFIRPNKSKGISDPLDILVERAVEKALTSGKSVEECMPPGLSYGSYDKLTVTLRRGTPSEDIPKPENEFSELDKALGGDTTG